MEVVVLVLGVLVVVVVVQGLVGFDYILRGAGVVFRHWPVGSGVT